MVSHDLRTPLAVIKGHAQVVETELAARRLDGMLQDSMKAIDRGVDRMDVMIGPLSIWHAGKAASLTQASYGDISKLSR